MAKEPPPPATKERWTEIDHEYWRTLGEIALIDKYGYNEAMHRIEAVEKMNRKLVAEDKKYILIVPGRLCTRDPLI